MKEAEQILKLFDSFWFERSIFTCKDRNFAAENIHEKTADDDHIQDSSMYAATNLQYTRSFSDHYLGHKAIDRLIEGLRSPIKPQLQKILSVGEIHEFFELVAQQERAESEEKQRRRKKYMGKSLKRSKSALEFEEVKGFIDLGFVFTEEDKDSGLVSIIPGLKKWGSSSSTLMADNNSTEQAQQERVEEVSRPYLSEAWKNLYNSNEGCNNSSSLMNWRIPYVHNENKMKNNLRAWAHTVASAVR